MRPTYSVSWLVPLSIPVSCSQTLCLQGAGKSHTSVTCIPLFVAKCDEPSGIAQECYSIGGSSFPVVGCLALATGGAFKNTFEFLFDSFKTKLRLLVNLVPNCSEASLHPQIYGVTLVRAIRILFISSTGQGGKNLQIFCSVSGDSDTIQRQNRRDSKQNLSLLLTVSHTYLRLSIPWVSP
ncbi:proline-rich transmembrane protein 4 [Platysternon megacephalum]|uniref:Proline-rich transmembrane protein 4 n=1 Tax=Platysternon megacephalum TaxID=55544 RepID=A0A4D9DW50_9SAUR|nr:proline-rich transmembrane protein 4 [Platysternon megacephalum]